MNTSILTLTRLALESCHQGNYVDIDGDPQRTDTFDAALVANALAAIDAFQQPVHPACTKHPDAPHGFDRDASHAAHRYVCDCEGWEPVTVAAQPVTPEELLALVKQHCGFVDAGPTEVKILTTPSELQAFAAALAAQPAQPAAFIFEEKKAQIRYMNLVMDLRRVLGWEKPLNNFPEIAELESLLATHSNKPSATIAQLEQPALKWCSSCGEGYAGFCRAKSLDAFCSMVQPADIEASAQNINRLVLGGHADETDLLAIRIELSKFAQPVPPVAPLNWAVDRLGVFEIKPGQAGRAPHQVGYDVDAAVARFMHSWSSSFTSQEIEAAARREIIAAAARSVV